MFLLHWFIGSIRKMRRILMFPVITLARLIRAFIDLVLSHELDLSTPLCVPTFYSPNVVNDISLDYALVTGMIPLICIFLVFAFTIFAMSGLGPPSTMPTPETHAWNYSVVISFQGCGLFILLGAKIVPHPASPTVRKSWFWRVVVAVMAPAFSAIFVFNRIDLFILFILAYIEFQALTPSELTGIKWTSFFPHI